MVRKALLAIVGLAVTAVVASGYRERAATRALVERLAATSARTAPIRTVVFDALPAPVARYLRLSMPNEMPIEVVRFRQRGLLRTDVAGSRWLPFSAEQVIRSGVGFVWNASVSYAPLLHLQVRDALVAGDASGRVALWSIVPVAAQSDRYEVNSGSLHRYLAEAVWCPPVLYASAGLVWEPIDDRRAKATLTANHVTVSLEFRFAPTGEVVGIYTPGRWGAFDNGYRQVPWEGHFRNYQRRGGLVIPLDADVGWYVAGVWEPVWQGRIGDFTVLEQVGQN